MNKHAANYYFNITKITGVGNNHQAVFHGIEIHE